MESTNDGVGDRLTELGKNVGGLAEELGVEGLGGDVLLDWFAGELLKGGPALGVACRVGVRLSGCRVCSRRRLG